VEHVYRGFQKNGDALLIHIFDIVEEAGCTSASGYYYILELGHLVQHVTLNLSECLFATVGEELGYCAVVTALDIVVQVYEL
jgi:hypothetical protein